MNKFKLTIFLSSILIFASNLFAQIPSTVTFFSEDGHRFWVIVDGERQNAEPAHRVVIPNLVKDFYRTRIIFEDESFKDVNQNLQLIDVENNKVNVTYAIRNRKGNMVLRIVSFENATASATAPPAPVNNAPAPTNNTPAAVNQQAPAATTNVTIQQQVPNNQIQTTTTTNENINIGTSVNVDGQQVGMNINLSGLPGMTTTTTTTSSTTTSGNMTQQQAVVSPAPNSPAPTPSNACVRAISNDQFQRGVNSIKNESFSDSQMRIARQFTRSNCLNVDQIITVIGLFSFEQSKLDYAKFAYDFCVDKGNYFMVNDAFTFSSSKDDLNKFLDSK
jgi:hypothetical protein